MRKTGLIMLLVLFLSVSVLVTAESLDGFSDSQGTILNTFLVENQTVTASISGVESVLSDQFSEQIYSHATILNRSIYNYYVGLNDKAVVNLLYLLDLQVSRLILTLTSGIVAVSSANNNAMIFGGDQLLNAVVA